MNYINDQYRLIWLASLRNWHYCLKPSNENPLKNLWGGLGPGIDHYSVTSNWEKPRVPRVCPPLVLLTRSVIYIRKWKWMATNFGNYNNILLLHLPDYGQKEKKPGEASSFSENLLIFYILECHATNKLSGNKCVKFKLLFVNSSSLHNIIIIMDIRDPPKLGFLSKSYLFIMIMFQYLKIKLKFYKQDSIN